MRITQSLVILAALALPVAAMADTTYNPETQFGSTNPSGVWTYAYGAQGTGAITDMPSYNNLLFGNETNWNLDELPAIGPGGFTNGTVDAPSSDLWMHPGNDDSQAAILIFTAQSAGTYYFSGLFERDDTTNGAGNGVGVGVYENSTTDIFTSTISDSAYGNSTSFSGEVSLAAGQTLDFEVYRQGDYSYDSTGLQLNISQTPEPSALILLGTGLLGVVGVARRKLSIA